uniref:Uncharacterized protein n=1 Tax=Rhizophora mucronata TaxID=61149 RepID=A0A2P2P9M7_RHIMU
MLIHYCVTQFWKHNIQVQGIINKFSASSISAIAGFMVDIKIKVETTQHCLLPHYPKEQL